MRKNIFVSNSLIKTKLLEQAYLLLELCQFMQYLPVFIQYCAVF